MRRLLLLLFLDSVLLVAAGCFIWFDNALYRGITYTPDPASEPILYTDGPRVGVNVYNLHLEPDPAAVTRTLELARDMGVRYVRMQLPWEDVEIHGWGDFQDRRNVETRGVVSAWEKYDRIVALADSLGLELILRIDRPPDWAREEIRHHPKFIAGLERDPNSTGPPDNLTDYSAFVSAVVRRYRGEVRYFQLWNEPNLKNEWNWQQPDPREFTRLLRFGYAAAKTANPDAVILFPSLAPVDGLDERAPMTEMEYLEQVYQYGGKDYFDIMSAQAYGLGQPPSEHRYVRLRPFDNRAWSRPLDTRTDVSRLVLLREVMEQYGDEQKAIWISEMGWNSAPETIPPERRYTWGEPVSEEQKAAYLIGFIERARDEWPWVGVMSIWTLRHGGYLAPDPADPTPYFALVERDWSLLPAYTRLQEYLSRPAVAGVGGHSWQHPAVESLADGWRLRFSGTHIAIVGGGADTLEQETITLDGEPVGAAEMERETLATGEPVLWLPAPIDDGDTGVDDGVHTLDVIAPGATPPVRFLVARTPPFPSWLWIMLPTALFGMLLVCSGATVQALYERISGRR